MHVYAHPEWLTVCLPPSRAGARQIQPFLLHRTITSLKLGTDEFKSCLAEAASETRQMMERARHRIGHGWNLPRLVVYCMGCRGYCTVFATPRFLHLKTFARSISLFFCFCDIHFYCVSRTRPSLFAHHVRPNASRHLCKPR